jgi:hypothetical protein
MFSRKRRWLAEVGGKLEASVAPSGSKLSHGQRARCALLDGYLCSAAGSSDCPHFGSLFSDKKDLKLVEQLFGIAKSILTERQKSLLVSAIQELRWNSMTLTRLCDRMSRELKMSYSTVKWNMRQLTSMKLLLGGTRKSKGIAARPTTLGLLIASMLIQADSSPLCNNS